MGGAAPDICAAAALLVAALVAGGAAAQEPRAAADPPCPGCAKSSASAQQPAAAEAIVAVAVNYEPRGDLVVLLAQDGDVLIRESDFRSFDLSLSRYGKVVVEGASYVSLRSIEGLKFDLDATKLELRIQVQATALSRRQVFDVTPKRAAVNQPPPAGAFLNYNITASGDGDRSVRSEAAAAEAGWHAGEYLVLTDGLVQRDSVSGDTRRTRLSTSATRDDRESLRRLVLGDYVTTSGPLGSTLRLGGVSWSRRYSLDPYFLRFPGQIVTGTATLPSEVFLYSNGVLVRRERVSPGAFELQNFVNVNGLQVTDVVIRDVLGNEQRVTNPFYFTDALLRQGLDEYSVDVGFERRQFGVVSNDYGSLGASAFYRYGVSDTTTLGARGETLDGRGNLGPIAAWRLGVFGTASAAVSYGRGDGAGGGAYLLGHAYQSTRMSWSVALRGEGQHYARALPDLLGPRKRDFAASVAFPVTGNSSFGVIHADTVPWNGAETRSTSLTYRQRLTRDVSVTASATRAAGPAAVNEVLLLVSYSFDAYGQRPLVTAQARKTDGFEVQTLQVAGGNYDAEGPIYRASVEHARGPGGTRDAFNPFLQYNFRDFVARAEYFRDSTTGVAVHEVGVSGAIAYVDGVWGTSRPVFDSFGIVKVDEIPGVRVYANNQEVGRTDRNGTMFIPRLASYFDNPIAIDDRDLPADVIVPEVRYVVSPSLRSGSLVDFKARRVHAVAGRLVAEAAGGATPFGGAEGELRIGGRSIAIFTARDGSFYAEDVPPGQYAGRVARAAESCEFTLHVPRSTEAVNDVGEVRCDARR